MAGHTGQSSQLFPVAGRRNAQFLATVEISRTVSRVGLYARLAVSTGRAVPGSRVEDFRAAKLLQAVPIHIANSRNAQLLPMVARSG